ATIAPRDLPAVQTLGLRVEPVSRFYPAQVAAKNAPAVLPLPTSATGGRLAILDAFPRSARLTGDEVTGAGGARVAGGENSGTRLAAVVQGELPRARIALIRAAGA